MALDPGEGLEKVYTVKGNLKFFVKASEVIVLGLISSLAFGYSSGTRSSQNFASTINGLETLKENHLSEISQMDRSDTATRNTLLRYYQRVESDYLGPAVSNLKGDTSEALRDYAKTISDVSQESFAIFKNGDRFSESCLEKNNLDDASIDENSRAILSSIDQMGLCLVVAARDRYFAWPKLDAVCEHR